MIAFQCPKCQKTLRAPEEKIGARSKCPQCGTTVTVPGDVVEVLPVESRKLVNSEKVFYDNRGVMVSNSRIIIPTLTGNTVLSTHLVASVSVGLDPHWQALARKFIVAGISTLCIGFGFLILPIGLIMMLLFPRYALLLTASGSIEPLLTTWNRRDLVDLSQAIQEAINYQVSRR